MDLTSHVYEQWVRDIRAWLEEQPGATEFDGSPLDGVMRVMSIKDTRIAELETQLAEARALVTEAKERDKDVYWLSREWHARTEQLATFRACDDFSYRLKTLKILTKIASEAGRLDNPVRRLTRILEIIGTFEG